MASWWERLKGATNEPSGEPSSARIYALWLIGFVLLAQFMVVDCFIWKLLTLDAKGSNAVALANTYTGVLRVFMLWSMLFDVATALSLYGINVWKYVAAMRTGQAVKEDSDEERLIGGTALASAVLPISKIVAPPTSGDDTPPSRVD